MDPTLLIAVFLVTSTVFMLFVGYMSTKAVLPSREAVRAEEFTRRMSELMGAGKFQEVIDQCSQELMARPDYLPAYLFRADAYKRLDDADMAIGDYTAALEQIPPGDVGAQAEILYARGLLWQQTGEHEMATRDFDDRLAVAPGCPATHHARAVSLVALGDPSRAEQDLDVAIELNPQDEAAYDLRSDLRRKRGESDGAQQDLLKAKRLRGGH